VRCFVKNAIVAEPGLRTVEECIALLLRDGEVCEGAEDRRKILSGDRTAGYIEITREQPLSADDASFPVLVGDRGEDEQIGS
jgi:hypothetical protein